MSTNIRIDLHKQFSRQRIASKDGYFAADFITITPFTVTLVLYKGVLYPFTMEDIKNLSSF